MTQTRVEYTGTRYRRLATAAAFAGLLSYAVALLITPSCMNEIADYYHSSLKALGTLMAALMIGFLLSVAIAGYLADRYGKLPMIAAGCGSVAVGAMFFGRTADFRIAVMGALLFGIGGGLIEGPAMALVADLYEDHRRTAMMNLGQSMFGAGAIVAPLGIWWLLKSGLDWRVGYIGTAAIAALAGLLTLSGVAMREEKPLAAHGNGPSPLAFVGDKLVMLLALGILLYVGAEMTQTSLLSRFFKLCLNADDAKAAASPSAMWIGIGIGRIAGAAVAKYVSDYTLIVWAMVVAAASQAALLLTTSPPAATVAAFGLGLGLAPVFPTIISRASATHPEASGSVTSVVFAAGGIGGALLAFAVGAAGDLAGLRSALWICFAALVLDLALFMRLRASTPLTSFRTQ